jgi:hypothetical protein
MEPWRSRLIAEHTQLSERLAKLDAVLVTGGRSVDPSEQQAALTAERDELSARLDRLKLAVVSLELPDKQVVLMTIQAFVMQDYLDILEKRIALP